MKRKQEKLESLGEVFSRMGFEQNSKQSTKAAFLKYLIKEAYGADVSVPEIYQDKTATAPAKQLSFFDSSDEKEIA